MSATAIRSQPQRARVHLDARGTRARSVWGLADQGISSLTNFVLGIAVARMVGVESFGLFALAFGALMLVQSLARSLSTEPYAVRYAMRRDTPRRALAASLGTSLSLGLAASLIAVLVALLLSLGAASAEAVGLALALAVSTPIVLAHDALRATFIAQGRPQRAVWINAQYALLLALVVVVLTAAQSRSAAEFLLWANLAYLIPVVIGFVWLTVAPRLQDARWWLKTQRDLWPRFSVDALLTSGVQQAILLIVAIVAGLAAAGHFRLILILLGPIAVLVQGVWAVAVPEMVRSASTNTRGASTTARAYGLVTVIVAAVWATLLLLTPAAWLNVVVGESVAQALVLLPALAIAQVFNAFNIGSIAGIRALGAARRGMWTRALTSGLRLVGTLAGMVVAAALNTDLAAGAAWGLAAGTILNVVCWQASYRQALSVVAKPETTRKKEVA